jgi:hypothetical protein|nr:MAG TPA: hypothetical protein [Caudoviricetes sp.]
MLEQTKGENAKESIKKDEVEVTLYDAINTLVAHGHNKEEVIRTYSREEITLFYEKCIKFDRRSNADFIESVMVGIAGAFGGNKKIPKLLEDMRK